MSDRSIYRDIKVGELEGILQEACSFDPRLHTDGKYVEVSQLAAAVRPTCRWRRPSADGAGPDLFPRPGDQR